MSIRKVLSLVVVLSMLIGCAAMTAFAKEPEAIAAGEKKVISVPACDEFLDETVYYSFTPNKSGTYAFQVEKSVVDDDLWQGVWLYAEVDGEKKSSFGDPLMFVAEAGVTYQLSVNYWGEYTTDVDYTFFVEKCRLLESITLSAEQDTVQVGDEVYVDVIGTPAVYSYEEITWTVSDETVVSLSNQGDDYASFFALAPGTVTLTATTATGKTASVEITVTEPAEAMALVEGDNAVTVPAIEGTQAAFTPENSGYYKITVDNEEVMCYLSAKSVTDGTDAYYVLEAGETYEVSLSSFAEEDVDCVLTITYAPDVVILDPVAIEITKKPTNTKYLKEVLEQETYSDPLTGLELEVTWSDGSKTPWSYDENFGMLGNYYLQPEIKEHKGKTYLRIHVPETEVEPKACKLTVLDISFKEITLADETPLQIVENSCGIDLGFLDSWVYIPLLAYDREVTLTFSDDSTVTAKPGDVVYGVTVDCEDSQSDAPWTKDGDNKVFYRYGDYEQSVEVRVEIVDSPVESLEMVTPPEATFIVGEDGTLVNRDGKTLESQKDILAGMSFTITYKDGSTKTVAEEDIEWRNVMGAEYPFVDGYPMGTIEGLLSTLLQDSEPPCEIESSVEYKGVSLKYTIYIVEEFAEPEEPTEPTEPEVTEPEESEPEVSEPEVTEPEVTEPEETEPVVTEPEETEPEVTEPEVTEPETTAPAETKPQKPEDSDKNPDTGDTGVYMFLFVIMAVAMIAVEKITRVRTVK